MKFGKRIMIATVMMAIIVIGSPMTAKAAKFNPAFYAAKYADVRAAFGSDATALYNHYITYGQKEGRMPDANVAGGTAVDGIVESSVKFNPAFYAAKYADVRAVYGSDATALYNHYITCGQKEGRMPDANVAGGTAVDGIAGLPAKFDPVFYAAKYADVRASFGSNASALYNHYITHGQKEGRMPFAGATGGEAVNGIATAAEIQAMQIPVTYYIKYIGDKTNDWRFQTGEWRDEDSHRELYYLEQSIKDGDILIVDGSGQCLNLKLAVSLNNITYIGSGTGIITVNSVENVYVLKNCTGIVNGNVTNAYVYDNAVANFNNNVTNLHIIETNENNQTVAVAGTVDYLENESNGRITRQLYAFRENTFRMENGTLKTDEYNYRLYPVY